MIFKLTSLDAFSEEENNSKKFFFQSRFLCYELFSIVMGFVAQKFLFLGGESFLLLEQSHIRNHNPRLYAHF